MFSSTAALFLVYDSAVVWGSSWCLGLGVSLPITWSHLIFVRYKASYPRSQVILYSCIFADPYWYLSPIGAANHDRLQPPPLLKTMRTRQMQSIWMCPYLLTLFPAQILLWVLARVCDCFQGKFIIFLKIGKCLIRFWNHKNIFKILKIQRKILEIDWDTINLNKIFMPRENISKSF